jgi:hypothetical protein
MSQVGFRVYGCGGRKEDERAPGSRQQDLVDPERFRSMKDRALRLLSALAAVAAVALAGGASLKGF